MGRKSNSVRVRWVDLGWMDIVAEMLSIPSELRRVGDEDHEGIGEVGFACFFNGDG